VGRRSDARRSDYFAFFHSFFAMIIQYSMAY